MSEGDTYQPGDVYSEEGIFKLPHQCDAWHIGSWDDLQRFLSDIQSLLHAPIFCSGPECPRLIASTYTTCYLHKDVAS